uniref:outer membrane protein assembly factor BamB family protein n=1 Tax=Nocardia noduli TaxID=2815722 RepID=UPI001C2402B4
VRFAAVVGAVSVWGGSVLAFYGRFVGPPLVQDDGDLVPRSFDIFGIDTLPGFFAAVALAVGLWVGLVAVVLARRGWNEADEYTRREWWVVLGVLAGIVVLPTLAWARDAVEVVEKLQAVRPLGVTVPIIIAGCVLVVAGSILLLPATLAPAALAPLRGRGLVVPLVAGVLVPVLAAGLAVRAGDDTRGIDHRTVAAVAVPPVPAGPGLERYQVWLGNPGRRYPADVVVAGAGFVVANSAGITAYHGGTGEELWHYRRTQREDGIGVKPESLRSLDDGVVLAYWEYRGWTALDARTGRLLWQVSDFTREHPDPESDRAHSVGLPEPLLRTEDRGNVLIAYDPRTGARRWSARARDPSCPGARSWFDTTTTTVYQAIRCLDPDELRVSALSGHDGSITRTHVVPQPVDEDIPMTQRFGERVVAKWGENTLLLNGAHDPQPLPGARWVLAADAEGVLFQQRSGVEFIDRDARWVSEDTEVSSPLHWVYALLGEYVVAIDQAEPGTVLRTWQRSDGSPGPTVPVQVRGQRCPQWDLIPSPQTLTIPGGLLIRCGGWILGYS